MREPNEDTTVMLQFRGRAGPVDRCLLTNWKRAWHKLWHKLWRKRLFELTLLSSGRIRFATSTKSVDSAAVLVDGVWHRITATVDGTTGAVAVRLDR